MTCRMISIGEICVYTGDIWYKSGKFCHWHQQKITNMAAKYAI